MNLEIVVKYNSETQHCEAFTYEDRKVSVKGDADAPYELCELLLKKHPTWAHRKVAVYYQGRVHRVPVYWDNLEGVARRWLLIQKQRKMGVPT